MKNLKIKLKIIYCILFNRYTYDNKYNKCWWLWNEDEKIIICFGKKNFHMFDGSWDNRNKNEN